MKKLLVALASLTMALGCGSPKDANGDGVADGVVTPNNVTTITPSTPVGTVSGTVMTTKFAALDGATVSLVLGGGGEGTAGFYKATTDAAGHFSFKNVPAGGNAQLTFEKMGFGTVRSTVNIPSGYGNVPISNANGNAGIILLNALTATVKFNVFTASGSPATGARGSLDVSPAGFVGFGNGTYGDALGVVTLDATVDAAGSITFAGVPDPAELARVAGGSVGRYTLVMSGVDANADGRNEFNGTVASWTSRDLYQRTPDPVILPDARVSQALSIVATNVESLRVGQTSPLRNTLKPNDKIYVLFNQPVLPGTSLVAKIVQEDCVTSVAATPDLSAGNTLLTLTPTAGWTAGAKYSLLIRATPAEAQSVGNTQAFYGYFFGGDPATPKPVAAATFVGKKAPGSMGSASALQSGDTLYINFDTPIRNIGGGSARVFFTLDLDSNGTVGGTSSGELGSPLAYGFSISPAEVSSDANNTFACSASGYTSRWAVAVSSIPMAGIPMGTPVKVVFPKTTSSSDGYQTIWGVPVTPANSELAGALSVSQ